MARRIPLAWLQLNKEKLRLAVALAGVAFAVVLVFMQLGFRSAMYDGAVRYHRHLVYDLVLVSPKTPFIGYPQSFSRRRLYQALALDEVATVSPVYIRQGFWRNPWQRNARSILVVGIDPSAHVLSLEPVEHQHRALQDPDVVLFDMASRPEYGPVPARVAAGDPVTADVNNRRVTVAGLFRLGTSFGIDGNLITSDLNFQRIFPDHEPGFIELGLIRLRPGADVESVRRTLAAALERDVLVLTREGYAAREVAYWGSTTPIGYVFGFGVLMGLIVGAVIVYQILFADVAEHLAAYATLKAMGYSNAYLSGVVLQQAVILAVLGFLPGAALSMLLYRLTAEATRLPLTMTPSRMLGVLALAVAMCAVSGVVALRKVRSADPAEIFT